VEDKGVQVLSPISMGSLGKWCSMLVGAENLFRGDSCGVSRQCHVRIMVNLTAIKKIISTQ
jgi:hypothetical protein